MPPFQFKQFIVEQDLCAMKVGTDGVLLGAWSTVPSVCDRPRCLDIGTGTGIIALMLAQRLCEQGYEHAHITALEIDPTAADQARQNFAASPWPTHLTVIPTSLQEYAASSSPTSLIPDGLSAAPLFDLIISNPPFYNATLKPSDAARATARHKDALPIAEITRFAQRHLTPSGRLALIYPIDYDTEVMTAAILAGLAPIRLCDILTKVGKPCKRRMAEFQPQNLKTSKPQNLKTSKPQNLKTSKPQNLTHEILPIRDADNHYTHAYRQLTAPFYHHLTD